jgi:hypothetical protein
MSIHIGGCHRLPMTEAPDFMLKIPKHSSGASIHTREVGTAREGQRQTVPEDIKSALD